MSGIAGIYNLDGRPADAALLTSMTDAIAHRGPDGGGHWIDGPVGLGHMMLCTTPESLVEKQPLTDETGNLCLILDGRVDNRDELRSALEAKGAKLRTESDAEMILRAYECWGEESPARIIGDFAFAIWDGRNRNLFCARDILGLRPFYYYTDGRRFLWASELQQLIKDPSLPLVPNEGMIGEYLASAVNNKEETLYKGIFRLPPAHFLLVKPGGFRKARYWDMDPTKEIHHKTNEDYAEHFLDIFKEAVRCRLRTQGRVGAELSGGLDSSSVVSMAQSLFQEGSVPESGFETFSLVFPGLLCDESAYIKDVVRMWDINSNTLQPGVPDRSWHAEQVGRYWDIPDYPNGSMSDPIEALAREKGFRVLLSGLGGDEWFTGSRFRYADLLRKLKVISLVRQVRSDSAVSSVLPLPSNPLLNWTLKPLIPKNLNRRLRRFRKRHESAPAWIDSEFAQRVNLPERLRKEIDWHQFSSFAQGHHYTSATSGFQTHAIEMEERSASWFGIESRHPLNDRRILEFGLALPEMQRWQRNQQKFILRQAMRDYLPTRVLQRLTKAEFCVVFVKALQALGGENLFDSLSIASMGWVDEKEIRLMYRQMNRPDVQTEGGSYMHVWPLWHIFGIELWFNTVFNRKEVSLPEAVHV
ncbi:MAG: asparagine synthase (glutamine-hydrolyzing) [Deltaproteobacteria bacterium]|nr:asparagine synthase (glutamine-hydrolyzing) [Deltaproteobacteria bacterium]